MIVSVAFGSVTFTVSSVLSGIASVTPPVHTASPPVHFSMPRPKTRLPSSAAASRSAAEEAVSSPFGLETACATTQKLTASDVASGFTRDFILDMGNFSFYRLPISYHFLPPCVYRQL